MPPTKPDHVPTASEKAIAYYRGLDDDDLVRVYRTSLESYRRCRWQWDKDREYALLLLIIDAARQSGREHLLET